MRHLPLPFLLFALTLSGCHRAYSPNTYASNAAQTEANVHRGVIIGVRQVMISASGAVGAATGGAAGGVAGSQVSGGPLVTALGAIGGTLVGGVGGAAAAQAIADTKGWEYIVQETGGGLVSVTQTSKTALAIGLHVLVISDSQQARIVPDYTEASIAPAKPVAKSNDSTAPEIDLGLLAPPVGTAEPPQIVPTDAASNLSSPPAPSPAPARAAPVSAPSTTGAALSTPPASASASPASP